MTLHSRLGTVDWPRLLPWGLPILLWLMVFNHLRVDWSINPQYSYGWVVPALGGLILWRRWNSRPATQVVAGLRAPIGLLLALILFAWLPLAITLEANPEWRLALWLAAWLAAAFSLGMILLAGGAPWLRHFAFPMLFPLIAVPWPSGLESAVIQGLMQGVAFLTVEVLDLFGIAALQLGNVIEIPHGIVGVDEACSGVRSMQTTLLVALTLGELLEMSWVHRLCMLFLGLLVALIANFGRTFLLVWIATRDGIDALHHWHDAAGFGVLVFVLAVQALLARWLAARGQVKMQPACGKSGVVPRLRPIYTASALVWLLAVPVITEAWFRSREQPTATELAWTLSWDRPGAEVTSLDIGETARAMLRCDADRGEAWRDTAGYRWQLYLLEWEPGRNSIHLARTHRPEICLTGVGMKLERELGTHPWSAGGLELAVRQYQFSQFGQPLHVFYSLWESDPRAQTAAAQPDFGARERIAAAWTGRRHRGQRVLQVAVSGPTTPEEAWDLVAHELQRRVEVRVAIR